MSHRPGANESCHIELNFMLPNEWKVRGRIENRYSGTLDRYFHLLYIFLCPNPAWLY